MGVLRGVLVRGAAVADAARARGQAAEGVVEASVGLQEAGAGAEGEVLVQEGGGEVGAAVALACGSKGAGGGGIMALRR